MHAAYCVRFLIRPNILPYITPDGVAPAPAGTVAGLHPVLERSVAEQPDSFARWVPSRICVVHFDSAYVGGRGIGPDGQPVQSLVVWSMAARPTGASGDTTAATDAVIALRATNGDLEDAADDAGVRAGRVWTRLGPISEIGREESTVRVGKTSLVWEGHVSEDEDGGGLPADWRWWSIDAKRGRRRMAVDLHSDRTRGMVGSLQVVGDDDLAESLKASPIRHAGPIHMGGTAEVTITP